jgi:hypothetical protein
LLVAKLLQANGWKVVFYTNKRGFGFDLWASRGASAILVEVKSSFGLLGSITLTRLEHRAAEQYGENYILAAIENLEEGPVIRFIQDPVHTLRIQERTTREHLIPRGVWTAAQAFDTRA